jgi:hypothetical protein
MPENEHDIEEMPLEKEAIVSDMSKKDEADALTGAEQSADALSSSAEDVSKPVEKDTLSIVRDVVGADKTAEASSAEAEKDGKLPAEAAPQEEQEEFSELPFHKHPRFKEVLTKLKTAETDATRYRNVETFIADQGLGAEEAADLLRIGGLMKTNPVEAWKIAKPTIQKLLIAAGEVLPDDLRQRRENGELTNDAALEISRSRAALQAGQIHREFETSRTQTRQTQELGEAILSTVVSWEADRKVRDPHFEAKMPLIQKEVTWLQATKGRPNTPLAVQAQLEEAYKNVSDVYRPTRAVAQKPAVRPIPSGQPAANVQPAKPKTTLDIIKSVVAQRTA